MNTASHFLISINHNIIYRHWHAESGLYCRVDDYSGDDILTVFEDILSRQDRITDYQDELLYDDDSNDDNMMDM